MGTSTLGRTKNFDLKTMVMKIAFQLKQQIFSPTEGKVSATALYKASLKINQNMPNCNVTYSTVQYRPCKH